MCMCVNRKLQVHGGSGERVSAIPQSGRSRIVGLQLLYVFPRVMRQPYVLKSVSNRVGQNYAVA